MEKIKQNKEFLKRKLQEIQKNPEKLKVFNKLIKEVRPVIEKIIRYILKNENLTEEQIQFNVNLNLTFLVSLALLGEFNDFDINKCKGD